MAPSQLTNGSCTVHQSQKTWQRLVNICEFGLELCKDWSSHFIAWFSAGTLDLSAWLGLHTLTYSCFERCLRKPTLLKREMYTSPTLLFPWNHSRIPVDFIPSKTQEKNNNNNNRILLWVFTELHPTDTHSQNYTWYVMIIGHSVYWLLIAFWLLVTSCWETVHSVGSGCQAWTRFGILAQSQELNIWVGGCEFHELLPSILGPCVNVIYFTIQSSSPNFDAMKELDKWQRETMPSNSTCYHLRTIKLLQGKKRKKFSSILKIK